MAKIPQTKAVRLQQSMSRNLDTYVEQFGALMAVNHELALRILLVRTIIEQRGLDSESVSRITGMGKRWVTQALNFGAVKLDANDKSKQRLSSSSCHERLDIIEDAITKDTLERGGVYAVGGATDAGVDEMRKIYSSAHQMARKEAGGRLV